MSDRTRDERAVCRACDADLAGPFGDTERRYCGACTERRAQPVTLTLERRDVETLHELAVARAVTVEASEEAALMGLGSPQFRRPATRLRRVLDSGVGDE